MTKAQRNQILSALKATAATKVLTTGQIEERIATQLNSAEDAKVITQKLVKAGLLSTESGATNALTIDILEQAVANGILTASEMSSIASALDSIIVNGTLSASFKILTASIWASIKAIGVWLASNPIGWATMFVGAIGVIALGMKKYSDSIEETRQQLKETGGQAKTTVDQIKSDFNLLSSNTDKVKDRYAELAQEIKNLGEVNQSRGTLSTEDYEEFLGLSNQLAELYPQLTKAYDDNGNAILNLFGDVNTIVGSLNDLVSVQQRLAKQKIIDQMPDIWSGYEVELEDYNEELAESERNVKNYLQWVDDIENRSSITLYDENTNDLLREAARQAGIMSSQYGNAFYDFSRMASESGSSFNSATWNFSKLTDEEYEKLLDKVSELGAEYENAVQIAKGNISAANADMSDYINTWLSTEWNFNKMDSNMQNIVKDALLSTDWIGSLPDDIGTGNWNEVSNWLQKEFLYAINDIDNEQIENALVDVFNGNFTIDSLQGIINQLTNEYGFTEDNPLILYLQTKLTKRTEDINAVKDKLQDEYDGMVEQLSPEDLKIASEFVAVDEKDILTWDELIAKIKEYKASIKNAIKKPILSLSITDTINQLNTQLKPAFDSLKSAYQDIFTTDKNGNELFSLNSVNTDMLYSIQDAISKLNAVEGVSIDLSSYENLAKVLTNPSSNADDVKNSFNELASSIIDGVSVTKGFNDQTKNLCSQLLKEMGIVNADEIVLEKLNQSKIQQKAASIDFSDATADEIRSLIAYGEKLGFASQQVYGLYLQQLLVNNDPLQTKNSILQLIGLCQAGSETADTLVDLYDIMDAISKGQQKLANGELTAAQAEVTKSEIEKLKKKMSDTVNNMISSNTEIDWSGTNNKISFFIIL